MAAYAFGNSWRYRAWDNTQEPVSFDGNDVLASISNDLLYHGDLDAALRRLLRDGFETPDGNRVAGLRELLEQIRERREELEANAQPNDMVRRVAEALDEIVSTERGELDDAVARAMQAGDENEVARSSEQAASHQSELDMLPSDPAGQIHELSSYDFVSQEARERFEQLVEDLQRDLVQMQLDEAAGAMASQSPEEREHLRAGLDALNRMLEQRAAGEELDPTFASFMENFGDMFPGNPQTLDELLEQLASRMAAASAMVASMSPEQRAQLEEIGAEILGDMDLAWQLDRLNSNLRDALPSRGWDKGFPTQGTQPFSLGQAGEMIGELAELSDLEQFLQSATDPAALAEVDFDAVEARLGKEARTSLENLAELTRHLEEQGHAERRGGRLELTPRGLRRLGQQALSELFSKLRHDRFGNHPVPSIGLGQDQTVDTKPYEFGDPFRLHIEQTMRNAIVREASEHEADQTLSFPLQLVPDDFAIAQTEQVSTASTVLAIDLSLSMPMRDNFLAAKKVAVALQALIESRYPRDYLGLVGFSATARELKKEELPELSWDFAYGTNLQHALWLSRRMLAHRTGSKQIILITDGEPTAHVLDDGEIFFNYPPVPETIEATYAEVLRCTREHIVINAFVLDATSSLRSFIEQMTRRNRGRAFFTTPETLGDYVLVDFVEHRRSATRRLRPA